MSKMGRDTEPVTVNITDQIFNWSLAFCTATTTISLVTYFENEPIPAVIIVMFGMVATGLINFVASGLRDIENIGITAKGKEWLNSANLLLATKVGTVVFGLTAIGFAANFILK